MIAIAPQKVYSGSDWIDCRRKAENGDAVACIIVFLPRNTMSGVYGIYLLADGRVVSSDYAGDDFHFDPRGCPRGALLNPRLPPFHSECVLSLSAAGVVRYGNGFEHPEWLYSRATDPNVALHESDDDAEMRLRGWRSGHYQLDYVDTSSEFDATLDELEDTAGFQAWNRRGGACNVVSDRSDLFWKLYALCDQRWLKNPGAPSDACISEWQFQQSIMLSQRNSLKREQRQDDCYSYLVTSLRKNDFTNIRSALFNMEINAWPSCARVVRVFHNPHSPSIFCDQIIADDQTGICVSTQDARLVPGVPGLGLGASEKRWVQPTLMDLTRETPVYADCSTSYIRRVRMCQWCGKNSPEDDMAPADAVEWTDIRKVIDGKSFTKVFRTSWNPLIVACIDYSLAFRIKQLFGSLPHGLYKPDPCPERTCEGQFWRHAAYYCNVISGRWAVPRREILRHEAFLKQTRKKPKLHTDQDTHNFFQMLAVKHAVNQMTETVPT